MNRIILFFITGVMFYCCRQPQNQVQQIDVNKKTTEDTLVLIPEIGSIFDSTQLAGTIVIFDPDSGKYFSNDFERAAKGYLPASTFKIPNSIIALETGIVKDDSTLFIWDGKPRRLKVWEQDLIFRDAFQLSCVTCYQQLARSTGAERMNKYLSQFHYGNMHVDSSSIDVFWLEGTSTITAFEQIEFLYRFYNGLIGISERTNTIMKRIMLIDETPEYKLYGKTGWAIRDSSNIGWFTGFVEKQDKVYYFATNVEPLSEFNMEKFGKVRYDITISALDLMGVTKQ